MDLTLVGYFLKRTSVPDGWLLPTTVLEICSVSNCMNQTPTDWINRWIHNELGFFNTPDEARTTLVNPLEEYRLFAYRLLPVRFFKGTRTPLAIPKLSVEPLPQAFISLGFDVVSRSDSDFFECSPLSCNGLAQEVPVNSYCLVNTLAAAESLADRCSREEPEPGPYFVLEVLRDELDESHRRQH